jgi:hypothetical protein
VFVYMYIHGNGDAVCDHTPDVRELARYNNVAYPDQVDTGASVNTRCRGIAKFKYRAAKLSLLLGLLPPCVDLFVPSPTTV